MTRPHEYHREWNERVMLFGGITIGFVLGALIMAAIDGYSSLQSMIKDYGDFATGVATAAAAAYGVRLAWKAHTGAIRATYLRECNELQLLRKMLVNYINLETSAFDQRRFNDFKHIKLDVIESYFDYDTNYEIRRIYDFMFMHQLTDGFEEFKKWAVDNAIEKKIAETALSNIDEIIPHYSPK